MSSQGSACLSLLGAGIKDFRTLMNGFVGGAGHQNPGPHTYIATAL